MSTDQIYHCVIKYAGLKQNETSWANSAQCIITPSIAASVTGLQQTFNICYSFAQFNDIIFNHKKSVCFKVGPLWSKSAPVLLLGNKDLQWVTSFKYLGINFLSGQWRI